MPHIDRTSHMSFAAVGLWHVAVARFGESCTDVDLLSCQPDATHWHPDARLEPLDRPLDELMAEGFVQTHGGRYWFYAEMDD